MLPKDNEHRDFDSLVSADRVAKHRSLGNGQPDVESDQHQHGARQERDPPAEREELLVGEPVGKRKKHCAGEKEPDGRTKLREHAVPGPLAGWRVLDRQEHGAAPLATEAEPLSEAAERQQDRSRNANRVVGRQRADHDGGNPHRQQRRDERGLAPDAIAEVTEKR